MAAYEKDLLQDALKSARGNRAKAARLLQHDRPHPQLQGAQVRDRLPALPDLTRDSAGRFDRNCSWSTVQSTFVSAAWPCAACPPLRRTRHAIPPIRWWVPPEGPCRTTWRVALPARAHRAQSARDPASRPLIGIPATRAALIPPPRVPDRRAHVGAEFFPRTIAGASRPVCNRSLRRRYKPVATASRNGHASAHPAFGRPRRSASDGRRRCRGSRSIEPALQPHHFCRPRA